MAERKKDFFYKQAKHQGIAARSFFKLEDLDEKYRLVKKGYRVMDIGAAPGSWIQYVQEKVGEEGFIYATDLNPLKVSIMTHVLFEQKNIFDLQPEDVKQEHGMFDLIISDVAPRTMGHRTVDHTRSYELCVHVLEIAKVVLKKNMQMLCKMYQGQQTKKLVDEMKKVFSDVKIQKPDASRKESKEIFILGISKK